MAKKYVPAKYPRIIVSPARHKQLFLEAQKKGITTEKLAEQKFKAAK